MMTREVVAERFAGANNERTEHRVDGVDDPQGMFELLHSGCYGRFFVRRRTASTNAAAATEEAPASSPKGCRRKRAIITYARKPSKAYRRAIRATVHTNRRRTFTASPSAVTD